jgi:hypothetical protein
MICRGEQGLPIDHGPRIEVLPWIAAVAVAIALILFRAAPAHATQPFTFPPTDFLILSPDGANTLGYCSFRLIKSADGAAVLRGDARYLNGETDYESVSLQLTPDGLPRPIAYQHFFYYADRSPMLAVRANFQSGQATCSDYRADSQYNETSSVDFPPDTWAGASIAIPIQHYLQLGDSSTHELHFFTCTPGPKIFALDYTPDSARSRWPYYKGDLVRVDVRPYFGPFDILVRAFVPHLQAWFDPITRWDFVGANMTRFYRGPEIIMVKAPEGKTPPADKGAVDTAARRNGARQHPPTDQLSE